MTSITTNVKHRVRTSGSEQYLLSISDPDKNLAKDLVVFFISYARKRVLNTQIPPGQCALVHMWFENDLGVSLLGHVRLIERIW